MIRSLRKYHFYYLLMLPGILYFLVFHYIPMYGVTIAFKDITPFDGGFLSGHWVGLSQFTRFYHSYYFWDVLDNTVMISFYKMLFGFPAPILLALLINEVRLQWFKRIVQSVSYLPHFLSWVIVSGIVMNLLDVNNGLLNSIIVHFGGNPISFLTNVHDFRSILVSSDVWQSVGWGSILYLAAMAGIPPELYEAATIDGANRWQKIRHITLPGISFVIVILFILHIGRFMDAGFEQILLLYSPPVYQVSDIIDTYVYRQGLVEMQFSFATAIGLFKNVIGAILLIGANYLAKKLDQPGLW